MSSTDIRTGNIFSVSDVSNTGYGLFDRWMLHRPLERPCTVGMVSAVITEFADLEVIAVVAGCSERCWTGSMKSQSCGCNGESLKQNGRGDIYVFRKLKSPRVSSKLYMLLRLVLRLNLVLHEIRMFVLFLEILFCCSGVRFRHKHVVEVWHKCLTHIGMWTGSDSFPTTVINSGGQIYWSVSMWKMASTERQTPYDC